MTHAEHMQACLDDHMRTPFYRANKAATGLATLERIPVDAQGYVSSGRYYGQGAPLFCVEIDSPTEADQFHFRAPDRETLRAALKALYPSIKVAR